MKSNKFEKYWLQIFDRCFFSSRNDNIVAGNHSFCWRCHKMADYSYNGCGVGVDYKHFLMLINNHMQNNIWRI